MMMLEVICGQVAYCSGADTTLITFQEQARQERLQTVLKNLLDCVEDARHNLTPTPTPTRPGSIRTGSSGPAGLVHTGMTSASGKPSESPGINTGTNRPPPAPTVNNEMQRSFPGLFLKKQGKRRFQEAKSIRTVSIQFFLLPEHTDRTPKGAEELRLLQAGLGRRVVSLPDNATHKEIVSILEKEYHKIKQLAGGWLCYKAAGMEIVV
ncbi:uncharacterized protein LOC127160195 [Labeo rohita]|uniref:uncharacterized protein LOC127160195 n=1 Tax=Labeo rohita TaxID=84645 RepID=UPI0021E1DB84|nr:uncharacterized protein LOC127160195 [Labeo rohita]